MTHGVHGEKLIALSNNPKLPASDMPKLHETIHNYNRWISDMEDIHFTTLDETVNSMVTLFNNYKLFVDVDLIFDSDNDFLYRSKGQLKLDNTVIEEFLPMLTEKCLATELNECNINVGSQISTFSSLRFTASLNAPLPGGGMEIKTKDQDFSLSRKIYLQSSYSSRFEPSLTTNCETHLGYVLAELKTNLDKTMFQEASATAHDVKLAVTGAKYFLLCDFLDMKPISNETTDINEILILRKAKRLSSNVRSTFSTYIGRQEKRTDYVNFLTDNPYSSDVFLRFINHLKVLASGVELDENNVLSAGYF